MSRLQVQWAFDEGSGLEDYPPAISATIEAAFVKKQKTVEFTEEDPDTNKLITTTIDFDKMEEYQNGNTRNPRKVQRKAAGTGVRTTCARLST